MAQADWNPDLYARFAGLRLQPALDLATRIRTLPPGDVVDLGCGNGPAGPLLAARFAGHRLVGLDNSDAMLAKARATGAYDTLQNGDIAGWTAETPPALIFSNAALHWLPDHDRLLPRLVSQLAPGGTLAVQIPHQNRAPSHRVWHQLVEDNFPGRFDPASFPSTLEPVEYHRILSPLGQLTLWETEYFQQLPPSDDGHPVRGFTSSTFARPVFDVLDEGEQVMLTRLYDEVMEAAYPRAADGSVLFPFRRLFFMLDLV